MSAIIEHRSHNEPHSQQEIKASDPKGTFLTFPLPATSDKDCYLYSRNSATPVDPIIEHWPSTRRNAPKKEVLLPPDSYCRYFVYNEGQIPGIKCPLRLLTDNTVPARAIWSQDMSLCTYNSHESRFVLAV